MRIGALVEALILGAMWGPSFLLIKLGITAVSPVTLVTGRIAIGGVFLLCVLKLQGGKLPRGDVWKKLLLMGLFATTLPFLGLTFAEERISSGLAGIINGLTPICAILLAHFVLESEKLSLRKVVGVTLGCIGFAMIVTEEVIASGIHGDLWSVVLAVAASTCYGVGIVYGKKHLSHLPPLVAPTGMLLVSALYLIPIAIFIEPLTPRHPTFGGYIAVVTLGLISTGAAFAFYYRILKKSGAGMLAISTYTLPVWAALLGAVILGEQFSLLTGIAGVIILAGIVIAQSSTVGIWRSRRE